MATVRNAEVGMIMAFLCCATLSVFQFPWFSYGERTMDDMWQHFQLPILETKFYFQF